MKSSILLISIILAIAFLLSACAGGRFAATSWPGISTQEGTVYLAFGSHVFALDAVDGHQIWQFPVERDQKISFYAAPISTRDHQLIIGGYDNVLYSLNPSTGQENTWTFEGARNRFIGSPLITEEGIFAPSADGRLYAMDLNGNQLWEPFNTEGGQWAQPTSDGEKIYLTSLDHNLYAIDMRTGREVWRIDLGGAIVGKPILGEGTVYVGNFAKKLVAVNTSTGAIDCEFTTRDWIWSGPALGGNTVYFGDISGAFYSLDAKSCNENWRFEEANGGIYGTPLITENTIYFATDAGWLYAFSPEGEQLPSREYGGKIYTSPTLAGNLILVASLLENDILLIAVDEDGSTKWHYPPENQ